MSSAYRGYEIRHRTVRDGEGFPRYNAEIKVNGEWQLASCEALDDDTVDRDLDAFIDEIAAAATQLSRQPQAATQFGDHKWWPLAMDKRGSRERGKGRNLNPSYA